jgi:hypothetical protein
MNKLLFFVITFFCFSCFIGCGNEDIANNVTRTWEGEGTSTAPHISTDSTAMILARVAVLEYRHYHEIAGDILDFTAADRARFPCDDWRRFGHAAYMFVNNIGFYAQSNNVGSVLNAIAFDNAARENIDDILERNIVTLGDLNNPTADEYARVAGLISIDASMCRIGDVYQAIIAAKNSRDELRNYIIGQLNLAVTYYYLTRAEADRFIDEANNLANDFDALISDLNKLIS